MSFQRMLEMARRHGMPLVVTDPNGKEPMVVLPLEVYEALVEGSPAVATAQAKRPVGEPVMVPVRDASAPPAVKRQNEPELMAELSLEERFYIEPLEEGKNS